MKTGGWAIPPDPFLFLGTFPLPLRTENLSDLRGEKQGKRHVAYLVLQLLDPIDMCILILENVFQDLPCSKVVDFSGELDGLIVSLDCPQPEPVIGGGG